MSDGPIIYRDIEQGSDAWRQARLGVPTASEFSCVLAKGRGSDKESRTRRKYLRRLAAEIVTGKPCETYGNHHMDRGHVQEPEARDLYAFAANCEPEQVGFIRNGRKGCSPDALIGSNGMLEIKSKEPDLLVGCLIDGTIPSEHVAQLQGALWVAEREWIDLVCYAPNLPLFVQRAYREEDYIRKLSDALDLFLSELDATVRFVQRYGMAEAA